MDNKEALKEIRDKLNSKLDKILELETSIKVVEEDKKPIKQDGNKRI